MARFLHEAEETAIARFNDLVGLGVEYRAAKTIGDVRRAIAAFGKRGYEIDRRTVSDGSDRTMRYRMILLRDGVETAWQDIEVAIRIGGMEENA